MKTKYILHGGSAQHVNAENDLFFTEILKDTSNPTKILLVHFASEAEMEAINSAKDIAQFERARGNKSISFEVAEEFTFVEQIKKADVIYLAGGFTSKLLDVLKKFKNLKELFFGKTIAGESAGANSLAAYCYSPANGEVLQGLGLVPVKMFPHYNGKRCKDLDKVRVDLEMLLLPNYKYRVFQTLYNQATI